MHQPLILALLQKVYWLDDVIQDRLVSLGFPRASRSQLFIILNVLSGTTCAADIARNLGVSRQAISVKLIELQKSNVVTLEEDPSDRRSKLVGLSECFQANADDCVKVLNEVHVALEDAFGKNAIRSFVEILHADWSEILSSERGKPAEARKAAAG